VHRRIASPQRTRGSRLLPRVLRVALADRRAPGNFVICTFVGHCCACLIARICSEFDRYWVSRHRKMERKAERKMKRKVERKVTSPGVTGDLSALGLLVIPSFVGRRFAALVVFICSSFRKSRVFGS
jgi:hypothetical protein